MAEYDFETRHQWKDRYHYLPTLLNSRKDVMAIGVEVGVAAAGHADAILSKCPWVQLLIGVDSYQHRENYQDLMNLPQEEFEALHQYVTDTMWEKHRMRFNLYRVPSLTAAFSISQGRVIDFIYIDAEHTMQECLIDIAVWHEVLRPGGIMSGDDYSMAGVSWAVNYFTEKHGKKLHVEDNLFWWFEK